MGKSYLEKAEAMELYAPIARQAGSHGLLELFFDRFVDLGASLGFRKLRPTGAPGYGIACSNSKYQRILMSLFVEGADEGNTLVLALNPDACEIDPRCAQFPDAHRQFGQSRGLLTPSRKKKHWISVKLSSKEHIEAWMAEVADEVLQAGEKGPGNATLAQASSRDPVEPPEGVDPHVWRQIRDRRGQGPFRKALLRAYKERCAMSGCNAVDALEAAHITPVVKHESYVASSGLLLRADIHTLFDLHLLSVNPETMTVAVSPALWSAYSELNDQALAIPEDPSARPELARLAHHYELFRQTNQAWQ